MFVAISGIYPILALATIIVGVIDPISWYFAACLAAWPIMVGLDAMVPLREVPGARPSAEELENAKRYPNGWVYRIVGPFGPHDAVPPEAIVGAWKVDARGEIVGEFAQNRRYDPALWSSGQISSRSGQSAASQIKP